MKLSPILLCVGVAWAGSAYGQELPTEAPISLQELNRRNVAGKLGLPLGTAVEIDAEVVAGSSLQRKGFDSIYLLKVTHVNSKGLSSAPLMQFSTSGPAAAALANQTLALHEMKHGEAATSLAAAQIAELENGYVGKKMRLVAYEVGGFQGIPSHLPNDVPPSADTGFHFSTSLIVLKVREPKGNTGPTRPRTRPRTRQ